MLKQPDAVTYRDDPMPLDPELEDVPRSFYARVGKPVLDRVLAAVALAVLAPAMAVIALTVLVSLGWPVLFAQTRVGHRGRPFTVLKYRSMGTDRRATHGMFDGHERRQTHKSSGDPRHTPMGRLLRRLSVDELPQLVNVLRGDMSLVGPRPELPSVIKRHYHGWHHRRHSVKPGITGLWQVSERGAGMMHERVEIDLDYVDTMSFTGDLRILLRTIPAALFDHKGS